MPKAEASRSRTVRKVRVRLTKAEQAQLARVPERDRGWIRRQLLAKKDPNARPGELGRRMHCRHCRARVGATSYILTGGAMRVIDADRSVMFDAGAALGFLSLVRHEADGLDKCVEVVDHDGRAGQFEIYFCSTACLRAFFDAQVERLEPAKRAKRKTAKRAVRQPSRVRTR